MRLLRFLPRFQQAYRATRQLAEREQWSRAEIEAYQLDAVNRVWLHAIRHVPYYRKLREDHGLPERFATLEEYRGSVPLLPKSTVRQSPRQFLSDRAEPGTWERTSGSTGMPLRLYHDAASHRLMQHAKYRLYEAWGIDILDRSAYLWSRPDITLSTFSGAWNSWRLRAKDALRGRKRFSAFNLSDQALESCLRQMERFQPRALYGFSHALFLLARQASERGFSHNWLKAVIMTSEPATPRMRNTVQSALHAPAVVEYGATECELIAGSYPDGSLRVREDLVLLETLPDAAQGYQLVISVLANASFPLLRYQIEDATSAPLDFPRQGLAVLPGGISGRRDDLIQTRTGRYLHPASIDSIFEDLVEIAAIRRYRAHQVHTGALEVQIELDVARQGNLNVKQLTEALTALLEGYPVHIRLTPELQRSASSKHRAITSELSAAVLRETSPAAVPGDAPG